MLPALVHVVLIAKSSITSKEKLKERDQELQKTQSGWQAVSGTVSEALGVALSKCEEACSCFQQLQSMEEQLDLAGKKVTSVKAGSVKAVVCSKRVDTSAEKMRLYLTMYCYNQKFGNYSALKA